MPEMILPGVYIEEHAEGLIVSGAIPTGNIGIVGTAARGPVSTVTLLSAYADALGTFGAYDAWQGGGHTELTLVRALEQAYANGASTVYAVRVTSTGANAAKAAEYHLKSAAAGNPVVAKLIAGAPGPDPGTWGNSIVVTVDDVPPNHSRVTVSFGPTQESYVVASGTELVAQVNDPRSGSALVHAAPGDQAAAAERPAKAATVAVTVRGLDGADATEAEYAAGLDLLTDQDVQIVVLAGQGGAVARTALEAHVHDASSDKVQRERIAVFGDAGAAGATPSPGIVSGRLIYTVPGIQVTDAARNDPDPTKNVVTLPSAYTAAAIAGLISSVDPQVSLTNQQLTVIDLERKYNAAQLEQLVLNHVLAIENRTSIKVVKGITTDDGAFQQITTRRIVDYARNGVRANAEPYIGLLNNDRVRKALASAINGFLASMVDDEQLESYTLDVTATRDQEIRGICQVTLTLQPTFSIDYIKVVMYLQ